MINSVEYLIDDLKLFAENSRQQKPGVDYIVNRKQYFDLIQRVDSLTETDFKSIEKYEIFLSFVNQPQRKSDQLAFERNFTQDRLYGGYLWMVNHIDNIIRELN